MLHCNCNNKGRKQMTLEIHDMDTNNKKYLKSGENKKWHQLSSLEKNAVKCFIAVYKKNSSEKCIAFGKIIVSVVFIRNIKQ